MALGVALLVAAPFVARAWPVPDERPDRARAGGRDPRPRTTQPYQGLVRSRGGVELPTDDSLEGAAKLLGRDGTLRVWWSGPDAWRVATLRTTGETDLLHQAGMNLRWVYESKNVTLYPDTPVRLPVSCRRAAAGAGRAGARRAPGPTRSSGCPPSGSRAAPRPGCA